MRKIKFCILENDEKTFNYVKECLLLLEKRENNFIKFDNFIQKIEIDQHLERCGKISCSDEEKNKEAMAWISNYACDFRSYLNTIKLAASFLHYKNIRSDNLTKEEFKLCCEAVNNLKEFLSENIF